MWCQMFHDYLDGSWACYPLTDRSSRLLAEPVLMLPQRHVAMEVHRQVKKTRRYKRTFRQKKKKTSYFQEINKEGRKWIATKRKTK